MAEDNKIKNTGKNGFTRIMHSPFIIVALLTVQCITIFLLCSDLFFIDNSTTAIKQSAQSAYFLTEILIIVTTSVTVIIIFMLRISPSLEKSNSIYQSKLSSASPSSNLQEQIRQDAEKNDLDLMKLCELMQEGVAILRGGKFIYSNNPLAYLIGATPDEMLGTSLNEYLHPDDVSLVNLTDYEEKDELTLVPTRTTLRLNTRLGDQRWVICNVHPVHWLKSRATLLIFEHIGALKQAQRSLEEHEQQLRILIERTPLGIAMFDAMGQLKVANTSWYSLWSNIAGVGARRFNILQDPFLPRTDVDKAIRNVFNGQETGISALEHAAPWGETRWLNMNFHPMQNAVGQIIGMVMIQQDTTDSVRSSRREMELNEQLASLRSEYVYKQEQLAVIIDAMPSPVIYLDEVGTVALFNRAAEARFNIPRKRVIGQPVSRLEQLAPYLDLIGKAKLEKKVLFAGHIPHTTQDGISYEDLTIYPVEHKKHSGTVMRLDSSDARINAEQFLRQKDTVRLLSAFAERIMQQVTQDKETLPSIAKNLGELEKIIQASVKNTSPANINTIIEKSIALARHKIPFGPSLEINTSLETELAKVSCNEDECTKIFSILLDFVAKWPRHGNSGIPIAIDIQSGMKNHTVHIKISSRGKKIHPHELESIFYPFASPAGIKTELELSHVYLAINIGLSGKIKCIPHTEGGIAFIIELPSLP